VSTKEQHSGALSDLGDESFISLTTFKRDGTPVSTPVWVAGDDGRLLVHSDADTWKVKRIRRDRHVRVAPCGATGKVRGEALEGEATILADTSLVDALETRKYGLMYRVFRLFGAISRRLRRRPPSESVTIEIVPGPAPASRPGARTTDDRVQRWAIENGHAAGGAPEPGLMRRVGGVLTRVAKAISRWWRSRTATKALLLAGIAAAGVYVVGDILSGLLYNIDRPYSFKDQWISELTALGSPVRPLMVTVMTVHGLLLAAFAGGIWRTAGQNRRLRWAGSALFAATAVSIWLHPFFPMSSRWLERSFTDTMHETLTFAWLPIIFAAVALAAVAYRGWFRLYSLATVLVLMGFGAASGIAIQGLEQNDTPWAGVFERINAYALMAWFVVLAVTVMRRSLRVPTPERRP
jgi:PPOX class probable F420-dependent enzyme